MAGRQEVPTYRLRYETVSEDQIGPYTELSRTEYENIGACDPAHMTWKHLENPQGRSLAYNLYEGELLVGRICFQIREFLFAGQKLRAGYLSDLLIHPRHRGAGAFRQLMSRIREAPGLDLIYITPNAVSTPMFRSALGFSRTCELSVVGFPIRSGAILRGLFRGRGQSLSFLLDGLLRSFVWLARISIGRKPPSLRLSEQRPPDSEIDALIRSAASPASVEGRREARFHHWRFHASPFNRYRVYYVYQDGDLAGYVATRSEMYLGYRTLFIADVYFDERIRAPELRHIKFTLLEQATREGSDLALGIFMRENPSLARFCSFPLIKIPTRFLPQRVDMFVEPLATSRELPVDPARYYITLADLDLF